MKNSLPILCALVSSLGLYAKEVTVEGLIIPRDNDGMYVRNPDGQFEIEWTKETKVALEVNTRFFKGLKGNVLHYQVQASKEVIRFTLPKGPVTGIVGVRSKGQLEKRLKEAHEENWIGEHGLRLFFGESRSQQIASPDDLRFIGLWIQALQAAPTIQGKTYECSLKKGGQTQALLFNVLETKDCKPFVNRARVVGQRKRGPDSCQGDSSSTNW